MEPTQLKSRPVVVLYGSTGLIGSELSRQLDFAGAVVIRPTRQNPLEGAPLQGPVTFIFANGITDPRVPEHALREANIEFPRRIIEWTAGNRQARYVTLGSIMENFEDLCATNPYLRSKRDLGRMMQELADPRALHVRLHTVYGGTPKAHMFLGQIFEAIRQNREFRMSHGRQLREFHHVEDVAHSLITILNHEPGSEALASSVITLSSGEPVRLADLAQSVFKALDREHLLQVGAIQAPSAENTEQVFPRTGTALLPRVRGAVHGVTHWIKDLLDKSASTVT